VFNPLFISRGWGPLALPFGALPIALPFVVLILRPDWNDTHLGALVASGFVLGGVGMLWLDRRLQRGKQVDLVDGDSGVRQRVHAARDSLYFVPVAGWGWTYLVASAFVAALVL
jgi:hypothetical protein